MSEVENAPQSSFQRVDDFYTDYANNVFLEASYWDLKFIFGQLDQSVSPPVTEQRAAISVPWAQVKILSYFLRAHVMAYEAANGKINVAESVMPPQLEPPTEEQKSANPGAEEFSAKLNKLRDDLLRY
jgi:hypothetical protein